MYEDKKTLMRSLVDTLNKAGKAYYSEGREIMSNFEYDKLYDQLVELEKETDTVFSDSPTIHVGYEAVSELPKERHPSPMLSLSKTKDPEELVSWVKDQKALLSWKLDGLTIVLTYMDGQLYKAVTRGNGEIGEIITNNAKVFANLPLKIPYKGQLVIRGEALIKYSDFNRINENIPELDAKYKNPRNLCSGSVRQLNNEITAQRNVNFFAFMLVSASDVDFKNSRAYQFEWLKKQGFDTVDYRMVDSSNLLENIEYFKSQISQNDFPSDGLVILYDDIAYGQSLGITAKYPRNSMAFKWMDETSETILRSIEWSASRTGLINPVAIFDTVELEGTNVSRASVHNISVLRSLKLGIGDRIKVFKANMIIPQIAENLTQSDNIEIPESCPVCGFKTSLRNINDVTTLYCDNPDCQAKHVKSFSHFVSRDAMNIDGLSEQTLEKFIQMGFIKDYADLYRIDRYKDQIIELDGFGKKSYDKLIKALEESKKTNLVRLLYGLGIPGIGLAGTKLIVKKYGKDPASIIDLSLEELTIIDGMGEVLAKSYVDFFKETAMRKEYFSLLDLVEFEIPDDQASSQGNILEGKTFVITGSLNHFDNRSLLKEKIEALGGKATDSVTKKTTYLINNDKESTSSKNKKAQSLGIPIISEDDFLEMIKE